MKLKIWVRSFIALPAAFLFACTGASAAIFTVTNTNDTGGGSLRQALETPPPSGSTINITANGTVTLLSPLPMLDFNLTINGPGSDLFTLNGAKSTAPVLNITSGHTVSLSGVTVTGGAGGGILNSGTLKVDQCTVTGNSAKNFGGGIVNNGGALTVTNSTISNNTAFGDDSAGGVDASGGGIANFGTLKVSESTISGNHATAQDDIVTQADFLTRKGVGSSSDGNDYYNIVDPQNKRTTLGDWWNVNGFNATNGSAAGEAKVAYLNNGDLGFGRDMHMLKSGTNVASHVANYSLTAPVPDQNPLSADAAAAKDPDRAIATVCMEYAPIEGRSKPIVKFFVYAGVGPDSPLVVDADLDGNGSKFVPQLCLNCHGGAPPTSPPTLASVEAMGAHFREFDIDSFRFSRPGKAADDPSRMTATEEEQEQFRQLNRFVRSTEPVLDPGDLTKKTAIQELIDGWYGGSTLPEPNQNTRFVPPGWTGDRSQEQFYQNVVATSCRTCHVALGGTYEFNTYDKFRVFRDIIKSAVLTSTAKSMPHAKVAFANFWRSGRDLDLAEFSAPTAGVPWVPFGNDPSYYNYFSGTSGGGGIFSLGNKVTIANCTIVNNTARNGVLNANPGEARGGGILIGGSAASSTLKSTIVASNITVDSGFRDENAHDALPDDPTNGPVIVSKGFNLLGHSVLYDFPLGDPRGENNFGQENVPDPGLGALRKNGGSTFTHLLTASSAARDRGASSDATDQRGHDRSTGPAVDVGAVELQKDTFNFIVKNANGNTIPDGGVRNFGTVLVGSSKLAVLTISNTGTRALTNFTITKDGPTRAAFDVSLPIATGKLDPGKSTTFTVNFKPNVGAGVKTAAILINAAEFVGVYDIKLEGHAIK